MIPKKIHYIWLGKNKKPKNFPEIYKSWETFAKGFEIIEWNEKNINEFNLPLYFWTAMKNKKWAFASDVLRCFVLNKYGGVYLDIDLLLLKRLDEDFENIFLTNNFFTSKYHGVDNYFSFQFTGFNPNNKLLEDIILFYKNYNIKSGYIIINKVLSDILNNYYINKTVDNFKFILVDENLLCAEKKLDHDFSLAYGTHLGNVSWQPKWKKILYKLPFYFWLKNKLDFFIPKTIKY